MCVCAHVCVCACAYASLVVKKLGPTLCFVDKMFMDC